LILEDDVYVDVSGNTYDIASIMNIKLNGVTLPQKYIQINNLKSIAFSQKQKQNSSSDKFLYIESYDVISEYSIDISNNLIIITLVEEKYLSPSKYNTYDNANIYSPYLFFIDNNNQHIEYLISAKTSLINITENDTLNTNPNIKKIKFNFNTLNNNGYMEHINTNMRLLKNKVNTNAKLLYSYNSTINNITDINNNNDFNNNYFYSFKKQIKFYYHDNVVLTDDNILNTYTINQNNITSIQDSGLIYKTNNILINYNISATIDNTFNETQNNNLIINLSNTNKDFIKFNNVSLNLNNDGYTIQQTIPIINDYVLLITNEDYHKVFIKKYRNYLEDGSILKINYDVSENPLISTTNNHIYVKYNNNYYVGTYSNSNQILTIYYRTFSNIVWSPTFNSNNYRAYNENSLIKYCKSSNQTISNLTITVNGNVLILDYIATLYKTIVLDISGNNYVDEIKDIQNIFSDLFIQQGNLIMSNDSTIITDISYNDIENANTATISRYIKLSISLNNITGYKAINNYVSKKIIDKYLLDYYNSLLYLYTDTDDYIISYLKIISYKNPNSSFILWQNLDELEIKDTITYIYQYIKQMIQISDRSYDYINFTSQTTLDSVYYLMANLGNFYDIYVSLDVKYSLTEWKNIEVCIINLYNGMLKINKILHNNDIIFQGVSTLLINSYLNYSNTRYYNNNVVYLDQTTDISVLSFLDDVSLYIFNNYDLQGILIFQQNIIDLYNSTLQQLFNQSKLGINTVYNIINNSSSTFDINKIINNTNIIPSYNNSINMPLSYNIPNILDISRNLKDVENYDISGVDYYENNSNILNIANISIDNIISNYNTYIQNTNPITITYVSNNNILTLSGLANIKIGDYIGFIYQNIYNIYKILEINYANNNVTIEDSVDSSVKDQLIYIGINSLQINNYNPLINSSINFREAIANIIFNNFSSLNNVNYSQIQSQYWYYMDASNNYNYFSSLDNSDISYNNMILNKLNNTYKIKDIKLLQDVFNNVFSSDVEVNTTDNIIYKFCQIINSKKIEKNKYYNLIYILYKLLNVTNNRIIFSDYINEINIQQMIDKIDSSNINNLLTLINQTNKQNNYNYDYITINNISLDASNKDIISYMIIAMNPINDHIYPYLNTDKNIKFNIDSILKNKTITLDVKFNDIYRTIRDMKFFYTDFNLYVETLNNIVNYDQEMKKIAKDKVLEILEFNNDSKFNILDTSDNDLFYRNTIINNNERTNYFRLKIQQLSIWYLFEQIFSSNNELYKFYRVLPKNIEYNYDIDTISILKDTNITMIKGILDIFIYDVSNNIMIDYLDTGDHSSVNIYENKWISFFNDISNNTIEFDKISNLTLPCNYYYVAHLIVQLIDTESLTTDDEFIYIDETFKYKYYNFQIKKYTQKQINFLKNQKNKIFSINDWQGSIDGIEKKYLCNYYKLDKIINKSLLIDTNLKNMLLSRSNVNNLLSSIVKMINYLLMIILSSNGNYIESYDMSYNNIYPTLYLINGELIRITDLPTNYYYENINNYITIKRVDLQKNYNILQNGINKTVSYIGDYIDNYFQTNGNDFFAINNYNIDVSSTFINMDDISANTYLKFNYEIYMRTSYTFELIYYNNEHPIINNMYAYIIDNLNKINYWCNIDSIDLSNNKYIVTINRELSDDLSKSIESTNISIYGGIYNIINYLDDNQYYIDTKNILDKYEDYDDLSNKIINYMNNYFNNKYTNLNANQYFTNLISAFLKDQTNIHYDTNLTLSNYIGANDILFINDITNYKNIKDVNEGFKLLDQITNLLIKNVGDINNIKMINTDKVRDIFLAISEPYNIYSPKPPIGSWTKYLGHNIIDSINFYIGDELIEKITADYLHIFYELNISKEKQLKYLKYIGYTPENLIPKNIIDSNTIYLDVPWFFAHNGKYLPMIALINTKVRIQISIKKIKDLLVLYNLQDNITYQFLDKNNKIRNDYDITTSIYADYIYLDDFERNKFATNRHEYMIEQIQYLAPTYVDSDTIIQGNQTIRLNFNYCVKDMYWICQTSNNLINKEYSNYTSEPSFYYNEINNKLSLNMLSSEQSVNDLIQNAYNRLSTLYRNTKIKIDINNINASWFNNNEYKNVLSIVSNIPEYSSNKPIQNTQLELNGKVLLDHDNSYTTLVVPYQKYRNNQANGLNVYSFALYPMEQQPSGCLNFTVINDIKFNLTLDPIVGLTNKYMIIKVIARNYNILRVFSGMGACIY
jgi:hypothetical protein